MSRPARQALPGACALLLSLLLGLGCDGDPNDVDGSGVVDGEDLSIVIGCFGETDLVSGGCLAADVNGDGGVDILDVSQVSSALATPTAPDLGGLTLASAQGALVGEGLVPGAVTEVTTPLVPSGRVFDQTPDAGTFLAPGDAVDMVLSGPVAPEANTLPPAWEGAWRTRTTRIDAASQGLVASEAGAIELCEGDPIGTSLFPADVSCTAGADGLQVVLDCSFQTTASGCTVDVAGGFVLDLDGDTITGRGDFAQTAMGTCDGVAEDVAWILRLHAARSDDPPVCEAPPAALFQKLAMGSPLLEGLAP